jgi:hypothetical protein
VECGLIVIPTEHSQIIGGFVATESLFFASSGPD